MKLMLQDRVWNLRSFPSQCPHILIAFSSTVTTGTVPFHLPSWAPTYRKLDLYRNGRRPAHRFCSSGIWRCGYRHVVLDISKGRVAFIFCGLKSIKTDFELLQDEGDTFLRYIDSRLSLNAASPAKPRNPRLHLCEKMKIVVITYSIYRVVPSSWKGHAVAQRIRTLLHESVCGATNRSAT
jgi:hypothetical protein